MRRTLGSRRRPHPWLEIMLMMLWSPLAFADAAPGLASPSTPLTVGESFTVQSKVLGEARRINVYRPPVYGDSAEAPRPVLYMPDGGIGEDFVHVAGLLQVSVGNATMRPFLLVGIENTQRRRDLTGPTSNPQDKKIARQVGGSAEFRNFIRSELMPVINTRYHTTGETAIMGESLAGLFVVETLFTDPNLFDTYIALDPSLWWADSALVNNRVLHLPASSTHAKLLYLSNSSEPTIARLTEQLAGQLTKRAPANLTLCYEPMPAETHATIYHPAALQALRRVFKPSPDAH